MVSEVKGDGSLRVAALQLNSDDSVGANLTECRRLLGAAAARGARLAVLPENFAYSGMDRVGAAAAEAPSEPGAPSVGVISGSGWIEDTIRRLAEEFRICIIAGGFPEQSPDPARPYNTSITVDASGQVVCRYRKIHLFDVELPDGARFLESSSTLAGSEPKVAQICGKRVGVTICYDLRFPELYRTLVRQGAEVLVVTAAFTRETGRDHWHVLLRARAIESQSWVVAAAQWGEHRVGGRSSGKVSYGHSLVVDPWGTVVAEASDGVGLIIADLDFELLSTVRTRMPCRMHQRL